jgi:predicted RNA-binding Zn-ribbon protein involved in translation (DUF1610 family)
MPSYEFVCPECGFETTGRFTIEEYSRAVEAGSALPCPVCEEKTPMRRKFSPPSISIK